MYIVMTTAAAKEYNPNRTSTFAIAPSFTVTTLKDPLIFYAIRGKKRTDSSLVNGSIAA